MQNFIKIYQKFQGIGPVSFFFRIWTSAKPRPIPNIIWHLIGYILSISMWTQNFITIFFTVLEVGPFHFFRIWHSAKPRPTINVILQFLGLDLFNIKLSAKFYQNIPNSLRVKFHFFQNLNLGKTMTNPKCHLTISWATSCQYTNVHAKFHHNIPLSSRDRAILTFSKFGARQNLDRWKVTVQNLLG